MIPTGVAAPQRARLTTEGMFVIHLRSDSAAARQHLVGRIEHVKSGNSESFASVVDLLGFIGRHAPAPTPSDSET